jgi:hypothetical protein
MSCCFGPSVAQPKAASGDPTKHVNYVLGMVLGVDDLNQQFVYGDQRLQWAIRDLLGYGTAWGLKVEIRDAPAPRGPEVTVASGVAVNPRGQLIRVAPTQCASLNQWMAARTDEVAKRAAQTSQPNVFHLPLYLVLSYRECLTDPVPIAGEPCRTEGDATKPSRVADDFLLELRFDPPPQQEEDAIPQFWRWWKTHVTVVDGGAPSLSIAQFLEGIRAAAKAAAALPPTTSPPGGPGVVLVETSPPTMLAVPAGQLADYLRAALRLWVTELRPQWRPNWMGDKHGCAGDGVLTAPEQGNQVLLAALTVPIVPPGLNDAGWTVTAASDVQISEENRPVLLHLRFLQEWLLAESTPLAGPVTVAAGIINANGSAGLRAVRNGLRVLGNTALAGSTELKLAFDGYSAPPAVGGPQLLVKAMAWPGAPLTNSSVVFSGFQADGFLLQVSKNGGPLTAPELNGLQLMVEVSQYS